MTTPTSAPEIETDPDDPTREYIPLPGGWEIQTKGAGSTYRLLDKKTGDRKSILSADVKETQAFVTRMAKDVFAAFASLNEENEVLRLERNVLQKIAARRAEVLVTLGFHADMTVTEAANRAALSAQVRK